MVDHDATPEYRPDLIGDPLAFTDKSGLPEHLRFGQILPEEGQWLRATAKWITADQIIVELGSYTGKSASCLVAGSCEGLHASVYAVDLWHTGTSRKGRDFHAFDPAVDKGQSSSKFHRPRVFEIFQQRMAHFDKWDVSRVIIGHTALAAQTVRRLDLPVGLLFVDAEHTYEAVKADFEAWEPLLDVNAVVAFHDYAMKPPDSRDVARFVDELCDTGNWRVMRVIKSLAVVKRAL